MASSLPPGGPFRMLCPEDLADPHSTKCLGRQLQVLVAQGDVEFVRGIAWQVNARVRWLLEVQEDQQQIA